VLCKKYSGGSILLFGNHFTSIEELSEFFNGSTLTIKKCVISETIQKCTIPKDIRFSLQENMFDLVILLDNGYRDRKGLNYLKNIRKRNSEVPIIVVTSYGSVEYAMKAIRLGAFDFLNLPVSREELIRVAVNALSMLQERKFSE
jgi:DNA-binding NtrC family response regulator